MEYLIGVGLAISVGLFGSAVGLDRERGFYAVLLIVVALYYILFAAMGASLGVLGAELIPMTGFVLLAVIGFKRNPWFLVAGLAGHSVFDFAHGSLIGNPGVPTWWPGFCLAYDATAALYLALLLRSRKSKPAG